MISAARIASLAFRENVRSGDQEGQLDQLLGDGAAPGPGLADVPLLHGVVERTRAMPIGSTPGCR